MEARLGSGPSRAVCITRKVRTEFGNFFINIDLDHRGMPVGGNIATPRKEPDAQITRLVETLGAALNDALAGYEDGG